MVGRDGSLIECGPLDQAAGIEGACTSLLAAAARHRQGVLGLMAKRRKRDPDGVDALMAAAEASGQIRAGQPRCRQRAHRPCMAKSESLPEHPNGMRFTLKLADGSVTKGFFTRSRRLHQCRRRIETRQRAENRPARRRPRCHRVYDGPVLAHGKAGLRFGMLPHNACASARGTGRGITASGT